MPNVLASVSENGHDVPDVCAGDTSVVSDSSLYGFCSLSKSVSAQCRNAVGNSNVAVVTIDSVTSEVMIEKLLHSF